LSAKEALDDSNIPFRVDLHVWDEVPARFQEIIRKEHLLLNAAEEGRLPDCKLSPLISDC